MRTPKFPSFATPALVSLVALLLVSGCGGSRRAGGTVTVKGSDTMVILGQRWAEAYMAANPGTVVQVTGGGSGTGFAALLNGTTDVCQASRPIKQAEKDQAKERYGEEPHERMVARDGLAVYLNEANPVRSLTLEQVKGVYTGTVTNWKQLGGADAPITVYGRENSSGTYEYFKEHVLGGDDFAAAVQTLPGTAAVVNAVSRDPNGIGYGGAAYAEGVRDAEIRAHADSAGVLPTQENVVSGRYPISRGLYFYTRSAPAGPVKAFVDFAMSDAGQQIVPEVGYFPVR